MSGRTAPAGGHEVRFASGAHEIVGRHHAGTNGACVVMAGGMGVPVGPGTDRFAARFVAAGYSVLSFDFRGFGASGGPRRRRQVMSVRAQLGDWSAALRFGAALPEVDPSRMAVWSFSLTGGQLLSVAARRPELVAAVISQAPGVDGQAVGRHAMRHTSPGAMLRLTGRGVVDAVGRRFGAGPRLLPLTGAPGEVAMLTTPDGRRGPQALDPDGRYPDWQQQIAAASALRATFYRPTRDAGRVRCPVLMLVSDDDATTLARPALDAAARIADVEVVHLTGGHYAAFEGAHEQAVAAELDFLARRLGPDTAAPGTAGGSRLRPPCPA